MEFREHARRTPESARSWKQNPLKKLKILEGKMKVNIQIAVVRPAEFIGITIEQKMKK